MMDHGKGRCILRSLCSTCVVQCIICMVLLILGLLSRSNHGLYHPGVPPYYTASFITMTTVLLQSLMGFLIFYRGKGCTNKNEVAKKIGVWLQTYSLCMFLFGVGQIASLLIVGFAGICSNSYCSYLDNEKQNRNFAITILVFTSLAVVSSAIGFILVNLFSSFHGFKMFSRGQYQVTPLNDHEVTNIEQTPVSVISSGQLGDSQNITHYHQTLSNHAHHSHTDPRLDSPRADYSAHHVSHYLTQQFRERVQKRKKKTKKTNKSNHNNNGRRNGRQNRSAPYELPPLSVVSPLYPRHTSPPRDSPSPPSATVIYPPPSPPLSPDPVTPSSVPVPEIRTTQPSPPPWSLTPSPPPPPPSPPMDYLTVVHVIPYGEDMDDDSSLYSCD